MTTAKLPDGSIIACKYGGRGPVPGPVQEQLRLQAKYDNLFVEYEREFEKAKAAAWAQDPQVAPVLAAVQAAGEASEAARDSVAQAKQRLGYAKKTGQSARVRTAQDDLARARAAYREASAAWRQAAQELRDIKGLRWHAAQAKITAACEERDRKIAATREAFIAEGGFWASWADLRDHHVAAVSRIEKMRKEGRPAQRRFHGFDSTGSVTVQVQQEKGVTPQERARVIAMRQAGLRPGQVADALAAGLTEQEVREAVRTGDRVRDKALRDGLTEEEIAEAGLVPLREMITAALKAGRSGRTWKAQTIARMTPEGKAKRPDPPCNAAALADPDGKWRSTLRLAPELPPDFMGLPRGQRRRIAREGTFAIRTGAAHNAAVPEIPVTIHQPMPAGIEIKYARLTVRRIGPDQVMSVSLAGRVSPPLPVTEGGLVCVHTGWRVLPDGALRVAVISGAGPVPPGIAAPGGPGAKPGRSTGTVRYLGGGVHELVVLPSWREEDDKIAKLRSVRDTERDAVLASAAQWLDEHSVPPDSELPSAADVRNWRSGRRLAALGRRCAAGEHGEQARELGVLIGEWAAADEIKWRREARRRQNLIERRNDTWRNVAAWVCTGTSQVCLDEWEMTHIIRKPGPDSSDDPQAAASRANRHLAAPGELRKHIVLTAVREGITVRLAEQATGNAAGQVHAGCGGLLDPDARRKSVMVHCSGCDAIVDQDVNMLDLMAARWMVAGRVRREA